MKKDIKDYLHLYLGCECMIGDLNWKREEYTYGLRPDVDLDYGKPIRSKLDAHVLNAFAQETTLILRPLSDMTEEEKITLFDFVYPNGIGLSRLREDKLAFIEYALDIQMSDSSTNAEKIMSFMTIYQMSSMVQWTLSKGFDLFGLIEAGLAIDKTTLKQEA